MNTRSDRRRMEITRLVRGRGRQLGAGFTLIELALTLTIATILVALAQTPFQSYVMRPRRSEAILGLQNIYLAQAAFFAESGIYADTFDEIGFSIEGGQHIDERTIRGRTYTFTMRNVPLGGNPRGNFQAIATGDLDPGDGVLDILMIENQLTVLR